MCYKLIMDHQNNRRGPGRPKGTRGRYKKSRRDITKSVRFTVEEWQVILYIAGYYHMTPSSLIREAAVEYARKIKNWHEALDSQPRAATPAALLDRLGPLLKQ